jgi:cysteine desulfurase
MVHVLGGTVLSVPSVTGNFQSDSPLEEAARMALPSIFDQGWADPTKLGQDARSTSLLVNEARETIASHLGIRTDELFFLGEPNLGFFLGIRGLRVMREGGRCFYSSVDKIEIAAIAQEEKEYYQLGVDVDGQIDQSELAGATKEDLLCWQLVNGETGIYQKEPPHFPGSIFVDATSAGTSIPLPENWSSALWDSRSWLGPAGLGIFATSTAAQWRYPLPHLDNRSVPNSASPALIIASALAIDSYVAERKRQAEKIADFNRHIREFLLREIKDCDIAGKADNTIPTQLSFSFLYIDAERLVHALAEKGFSVDSGSACQSANMEPSHVLAAMGLLTHGNVRITLKSSTTSEEVDGLCQALKELVLAQRAD